VELVAWWGGFWMDGWGREVLEVGGWVGGEEVLGLGEVGVGGGRGGCEAPGYACVADWHRALVAVHEWSVA